MSFSWMLNLFNTGKKRDLDINDLYTTLNDHTSSSLGNALEKWFYLFYVIMYVDTIYSS